MLTHSNKPAPRVLSVDTQARKARAMAEIAAGNVGFHARIMQAGGNAECRALGHQADAELRQRDEIIRKLEWERDVLKAQIRSARAKAAP